MTVRSIATQTDKFYAKNAENNGYNNLSTYLTTLLIIISIAMETHSWYPWLRHQMQSQINTKIHDTIGIDTPTIVEFRKFDLNGDGNLDMEEFHKLVSVVADPKVCILILILFVYSCIGKPFNFSILSCMICQ